MRVYLAGPINGQTDMAARGWRGQVATVLREAGHEVVDPMVRDYRGREAGNEAAVVEPDKADVESCDAVLALVETPSVGTSMEILFAWERGIPVVSIASCEKSPSPWIVYHSRAVVYDLESAVGAVLHLLSR